MLMLIPKNPSPPASCMTFSVSRPTSPAPSSSDRPAAAAPQAVVFGAGVQAGASTTRPPSTGLPVRKKKAQPRKQRPAAVAAPTSSAAPRSRLEALPTEIIEQIAGLLPVRTLLHLRLTSSRMETATRDSWVASSGVRDLMRRMARIAEAVPSDLIPYTVSDPQEVGGVEPAGQAHVVDAPDWREMAQLLNEAHFLTAEETAPLRRRFHNSLRQLDMADEYRSAVAAVKSLDMAPLDRQLSEQLQVFLAALTSSLQRVRSLDGVTLAEFRASTLAHIGLIRDFAPVSNLRQFKAVRAAFERLTQ